MLIAAPLSGTSATHGEAIVIGLVNNMPDAALRATERQFHSLLAAASLNRTIRIRYFSLPGLTRTDAARDHLGRYYEDLSALYPGAIDGLIVTGSEPRAAALADEPYWEPLTRLIDWAGAHALSTIWSCLAAHAAVLHLDAIERRRLPAKLSGVYDCALADSHRILADVPMRCHIPHSRYNDLAEAPLMARGYQILSRSAAGADLFIKRRNGLDVFFQGHPEYEPVTLLREYRRDVSRFISGENTHYPVMPSGYFASEAADALTAFREQVMASPHPDRMAGFPDLAISEQISNSWREPAVRIFENWIEYLAEHKTYPSSKNHSDGHGLSNQN
jgi:homoserine O-succinyltransferase